MRSSALMVVGMVGRGLGVDNLGIIPL